MSKIDRVISNYEINRQFVALLFEIVSSKKLPENTVDILEHIKDFSFSTDPDQGRLEGLIISLMKEMWKEPPEKIPTFSQIKLIINELLKELEVSPREKLSIIIYYLFIKISK